MFIGLFLFVLFLYLLEAGCDVRFSLLGIAVAGTLQGAVRWYAYQYWMTDPAGLFLLTLALLLIRTGRDAAFHRIAPVAVLVRETFLVMFPYYFLFHFKRGGFRRAAALTFRAAAGPLLVLMIVSSLSVAYNTDRLLVYALPVLLPPALKNAESFLTAGLLPFRSIALAILSAQLLHFALTPFVEPAISVTQPTNPVVTFGMALLFALGAVRLAAGRRRGLLDDVPAGP